jgi:cobalt-precorrin-5B (C1)-methyltransferase
MVAAARGANTAGEVLVMAEAAGVRIADAVARRAREAAQRVVGDASVVDVLVVDRAGKIVGVSG